MKAFLRKVVTTLLLISMVGLTGCADGEDTGGLLNSFVHRGLYYDCGGNSSAAAGKKITIDGTEIKVPIDWNYANTHQPGYKGNNWKGDDAARGIGIFNCNEEGDKSSYFANEYIINMRWEYCSYGSLPGGFPIHSSYKGELNGIQVGGTSETCVQGMGIYKQGPTNAAQLRATQKVKVVVSNPETKKACVCYVGFNTPHYSNSPGRKGNCNWGGAPLALLGGITTKVSSTIGAKQNKSVLEVFFAPPDTPVGECAYTGSSISTSGGGNRCGISNVDNSTAADLAVSVAYDKGNPSFAGHEVIYTVSGSNGVSVCPTTRLANELRFKTNGDRYTADCGFFVSSVVKATLDKDFPRGLTQSIQAYCFEHPEKYQCVSRAKSGARFGDGSKYKPGDILVCNDGVIHHTFLYVGTEAVEKQFPYLKGKGYNVVSASQDSHGPELQIMSDSGGLQVGMWNVFRYIGTPDPLPNAKDIK